jgi:CubicO group peptidase (beta-lactamase class C family)
LSNESSIYGSLQVQDFSRRSLLQAGTAGLALAGAPALAASDQPAPLPPKLRTRVAEIFTQAKVPGAGFAIVKRGVIVASDGFGQASMPFAVPATDRTLFHIGSIGKQFTATAVLQLVAAGKIGLDDEIGKYVRDVPPSLAALKLRALLSHTSGAPDIGSVPNRPDIAFDRPVGRTKFLELLGGLPVEFAPGEAFRYCNTGFVLLGFLLADIAGRSYGEAIRDAVLQPAELREARADDAPSIIPNRAEPYLLRKTGGLQHAPIMDSEYSSNGAGGLLFSARDAARWEVGLQNRTVVPVATQVQMTTSGTLASGRSTQYGFGWYLDRIHDRPIAYHGGSVPGYISFYLRVPSERVGVLVTCNLGVASSAIVRVAQELTEHALPGSTCLSLETVRDDDKALTEEARALITRGEKPIDPARFAPEIASQLGKPGRDLAPPNRAGRPLNGFELVETVEEGTSRVRRYRATFADTVEHLAFAYAADGKIFRVRSI